MSKIWFIIMLSAAMAGCAARSTYYPLSDTCGTPLLPPMQPHVGSVTMLSVAAPSTKQLRIRAEMIAFTRDGKLTLALAMGLNQIARLERLPDARPALAGLLVEVGQLQQALGRMKLAQASYLRAIALYADDPFERPETLAPVTALAVLYRREGKLEEAQRLQLDAYPKLLEWLGPAHPDVIESKGELAKLQLALKQYDRAALPGSRHRQLPRTAMSVKAARNQGLNCPSAHSRRDCL
jgi:tetratricopeptide (TPR) repeat protein